LNTISFQKLLEAPPASSQEVNKFVHPLGGHDYGWSPSAEVTIKRKTSMVVPLPLVYIDFRLALKYINKSETLAI